MLSMTGTSVNLRPFEFEGRTVRVVTDDHGEPWFNANDVLLEQWEDNPDTVGGRS